MYPIEIKNDLLRAIYNRSIYEGKSIKDLVDILLRAQLSLDGNKNEFLCRTCSNKVQSVIDKNKGYCQNCKRIVEIIFI